MGPKRAMTERPRRILVVDDNVDVAELTGELLSQIGHEVRIAHDGAAALAQLSSFDAEVVLLDLGLPVMDGYELAGRIRASTTSHPFLVAVTGERDHARIAGAGFDAHLVKPVSIDNLLRVVDGVPS